MIPNKTGFEYHATSIAIFKTNCIPFHTDISFDSYRISISITTNLSMISKLLLLTRPIVSHSILSGFQFHVNKLSMTSILFLHRRSIDFNIYFNSKSMACIMIWCYSRSIAPPIEEVCQLRDSKWGQLPVIPVPSLK